MKHLQDGDKEVTSLSDIADTLAENFSEVSSSPHYNAKFQSHKERTECHPLRFNSNNTETYVGFVAAAVSMPMGGCRARRPVASSLPVVVVDVPIAAEPAVI